MVARPTVAHMGGYLPFDTRAVRLVTPDKGSVRTRRLSVLEAGFLWRARVLQGPAARHGTIRSVLPVVQVRMAGPGCLTDGCPNVHHDPLALVYLLRGSVWELPTQPQKGVTIAPGLKPAVLNQWTHIPPGGTPHLRGMQPISSAPTGTRNRKECLSFQESKRHFLLRVVVSGLDLGC